MPQAVQMEHEAGGAGPAQSLHCSFPARHPFSPLHWLQMPILFAVGKLQIPNEPMKWRRSLLNGASGRAVAFLMKKRKSTGSGVGILITKLKVPD